MQTQRVGLGLLGFGRMGEGIANRCIRNGVKVVAYDPGKIQSGELQPKEGLSVASSVQELVQQLPAGQPRIAWVMVPAGEITNNAVAGLEQAMDPGDIIIEGGNSKWLETEKLALALADTGVNFLSSGTSGGVEGEQVGYCLMLGGKRSVFEQVDSLGIFSSIAAPNGYAHVSEFPEGADLVKSNHNGIEYVEESALGEAFSVLYYLFNKNLPRLADLAGVWSNDPVAGGYLVELAQRAFQDQKHFKTIGAKIGGGATGNWTKESAKKANIASPVLLISSLLQRELSSMEDDYFRNRVVSALRWQFGRHPYEERLVKDTAPEVSYVEEEIELMKIRNACLAARAYAIAEGLTILNAYRDRYQLDLAQITKLWGHGSIIRSALMQKFADVLEEDGKLELDADIVEPKLESLSSDLFSFLRINFPELELGEIQNFIHNFSHVNISTCRGGFAYLLISSVFGKIEL